MIIFPEGTRTAVGAPPHYKTGVGQIYADCKVPCLPVAMNSGLFWPRRQFLRYPGTILVEFLDVMPAGLPRKEFLEEVAYAIETASNRLIEEGQREQARIVRPGADAAVEAAAARAERAGLLRRLVVQLRGEAVQLRIAKPLRLQRLHR